MNSSGSLRRAIAGIHPLAYGAWCLPALATVLVCSAAKAGSSQCTEDEAVLFCCKTGEKLVSVCASDLSADSGSLQYRFGPEGAPEIRLPPAARDWRKLVKSGTLTYSGGGGAYLAFENPPYRYIVYTAIGRGWGEKAGVAVEKDGKLVSNLPCAGEPTSELGPDLFSSAGIPGDSKGFDLP